ncbi:hypothetical protein RJ639_039861 [Escallonia herrerae]|uniref:Bromodomain-containing protein n=1 Tax=Escallonia herrerae TaxID=1293975 RepID=A0AA88WSN4_9ASTE|nr:hypothetical protein RJ639_039861 [Escallonia herrerae]
MASGTLGPDDSREKLRWGDGNKVYTRKNYHKALKTTAAATATANNGPTTTNTTTSPTTTATTTNDPLPQQSLQVQTVAATAEEANNYSSQQQQQEQTLGTTEEANSLQKEQPLSVSDDTLSHNPPPEAREVGLSIPNGNGSVRPVVTRVENRVRICLEAANSKNEIRELKNKLVSELDQVRTLVKQLEAKEAELTAHSTVAAAHSASDVNVIDRRGLVRVNSEVGSVGHMESRPFRQLSVSVMDNNHGLGGEYMEKEKRTPKVNQYYRGTEFLLGKERLPPESKKTKSNGGRKHGEDTGYGFGVDRYRSQAFKNCSNLLQRLMKHKHGWVFNEPVNAKALGLHDYHDIIRHPMDLGTVKSRLAQGFYKSPREFAEDVRLTFCNAMTYNPKGQDVHVMAEQLSDIFEERWTVIETEYNSDWRYEMPQDLGFHTPTSRRVPPLPWPLAPASYLGRSQSMTVPPKPVNFPPVIRTPVPKKPKARDENKRDMTYDEKQKLSANLQNLPSEKLDMIVQIIKKRNTALSQHDDEIEVDIDKVDAETLWELDRFVTNYKKSLSKNKRKAELLQQRAAGHAILVANPARAVQEAPKENKTDENNAAASSPVQGEKQGDNVRSSSSSSSSSSDTGSSSSDSDSDSSSADGSDHSPRT